MPKPPPAPAMWPSDIADELPTRLLLTSVDPVGDQIVLTDIGTRNDEPVYELDAPGTYTSADLVSMVWALIERQRPGTTPAEIAVVAAGGRAEDGDDDPDDIEDPNGGPYGLDPTAASSDADEES